jgi:Zn-dependent protease/predicted transcriptional regulator
MPGSFHLGKLAGIDIYINYSWIIILVFLTWSLATGWFPAFYPGWSSALYWITSLIASVLLFLSVLLHELAHSLVARRRGLRVKNITLFIFGGVSNIEQEPQSPGVEFQMTVVGPLTSLVLGGIFFLLLLPLRGVNTPVAAILGYLGLTNLLLGVFNLLPGFPLDGGRVLRSIIWRATGNLHRATRAAVIVGEVLAYLFILFGLWLFFIGDILDGIWFGFIGWYLLSAARSANTQDMLQTMLRGVKVAEVMTPSPPTVPANISLQRLVDEYFLPQGLRSALVTQADLLKGLITLGDIRHVAREEWPNTPVGQAMIPLERLHVVAPDQNLNEVLPLMVDGDVNQLPVLQDGHVVGVMNREALMRYLEVKRSLGSRASDTLRA